MDSVFLFQLPTIYKKLLLATFHISEQLKKKHLLGSLDAFPGGSEFDEDTILADAGLLVDRDDLAGLLDAALLVEGETSVDLRGHAARDNLEDFLAEEHAGIVQRCFDLLFQRPTERR